jgi:predicted kinase
MTEIRYLEMIIFIGIPASGKSTFYEQNFSETHTHISLDVLKTRNRENKMLEETFALGKSCVIDNTNVSIEERKKYIDAGKKHDYKVTGFYFRSAVDECRIRNNQRLGKKRVPSTALLNKAAHLERPSKEEGFDELYYVTLNNGDFEVNPYKEV